MAQAPLPTQAQEPQLQSQQQSAKAQIDAEIMESMGISGEQAQAQTSESQPDTDAILRSLMSPVPVGATAGALAGIPFGLPGMMIGAGTGGLVGASVEAVNRGEQLTDPGTILEIATEGLIQAGTELVGGPLLNLVFRPIKAGLGMVMNPVKTIAGAVKGTGERSAKRSLELWRRYGVELMPQTISTSRFLDIISEASEKAFFGGSRIANFKGNLLEVNNRISRDLAEGLIDMGDPIIVGQAVLDSLGSEERVFRAAGSKLYKALDGLISQTERKTVLIKSRILSPTGQPLNVPTEVDVGVVSLKTLKDFAQDEAAKGVLSVTPSKSGVSLLRRIEDFPENATFEQTQRLRSELLSALRGAKGPEAKFKAAVIARAAGFTGKEMRAAAAKFGSEAVDAYQKANDFWAKGAKQFNDKFLLQLTAKNPEFIVPAIMSAGPTRIKKFYETLSGDFARSIGFVDGSALKTRLETEIVRTMLSKATTNGVTKGSKLLDQIVNLGGPSVRRVFSPRKLAELRSFAEGLHLQQQGSQTPGGFATVLRQPAALIQVGLGGGLLLYDPTRLDASDALAGAILFGPAMVARMLTNQNSARILNEAITTPLRSTAKAGRLRQLVLNEIRAFTIREGIELQNPEAGLESDAIVNALIKDNPETPQPPRFQGEAVPFR